MYWLLLLKRVVASSHNRNFVMLAGLLIFGGEKLLDIVDQKHSDVMHRVDMSQQMLRDELRDRLVILQEDVKRQRTESSVALHQLQESVKRTEDRVWELYRDGRERRNTQASDFRVGDPSPIPVPVPRHRHQGG